MLDHLMTDYLPTHRSLLGSGFIQGLHGT
eukprot:COSAG02_NODE_61811_length_267_cov_1.035714_1_plen_28_part_10